MPAVVMREYRADHRLTLGAIVASQGRCEIHLDDTFLLIRGERVTRLGYDQLESIQLLPGAVEVELFPEGKLRFDGMDGALVRPLFRHLSRLRGLRWAYLLRFIGGELRDSLECHVQLNDGPARESVVHLYTSGVVCMPLGGDPFQLPIYELGPTQLSPDYHLLCSTPELRALLGGCEPTDLGRFQRAVEAARRNVREETSNLIVQLFPAVEFPALAQLTELLLRGKPALKADVDALLPWLWERFEGVIASSPTTREPYAYLRSKAGVWLWFGLRRMTESEQRGASAGTAETDPAALPRESATLELAAETEEPTRDYLFWYLAGLKVGDERFLATEVVSPAKGFATYIFRCREAREDGPAFSATAEALARTMLALNFFREPLYASRKDIDSGPFAEYRLAVRKLPYLAAARGSWVGRAIHSTSPGWQRQVEKLLASSA